MDLGDHGVPMVTRRNMNSGTRRQTLLSATAMISFLGLFWNLELSSAAEADMSKEYSTCMDKSNGVTADMLDCISAEMNRQDALLNERYKRLMSKLSENRKKSLVEAQRAWIKFRDTNCNFYGEAGSIAQVAVNGCLLEATVDRAKELEKLIPDQ
jgi:uncharacterized protein YecT (DUF1311 family)